MEPEVQARYMDSRAGHFQSYLTLIFNPSSFLVRNYKKTSGLAWKLLAFILWKSSVCLSKQMMLFPTNKMNFLSINAVITCSSFLAQCVRMLVLTFQPHPHPNPSVLSFPFRDSSYYPESHSWPLPLSSARIPQRILSWLNPSPKLAAHLFPANSCLSPFCSLLYHISDMCTGLVFASLLLASHCHSPHGRNPQDSLFLENVDPAL